MILRFLFKAIFNINYSDFRRDFIENNNRVRRMYEDNIIKYVIFECLIREPKVDFSILANYTFEDKLVSHRIPYKRIEKDLLVLERTGLIERFEEEGLTYCRLTNEGVAYYKSNVLNNLIMQANQNTHIINLQEITIIVLTITALFAAIVAPLLTYILSRL
ncbi:TPA: hypothetical protein WM907_001063 [Neisseria gonorrhoeae]